MDQNLKPIYDFIQQNENLTANEKDTFSKAVKDVDKELAITAFKLDRTEKVKRTTAILLEETIEELEHKRKAVEAQNRELEIEASLERVRTVAMGMRKPGDLLSICEVLYTELRNMGFGELRNAMINIHNDEKGSFLNYDFSEMAGETVTDILYNSHPATESLIMQIRKSEDAFAEIVIDGSELNEWREYRKNMGELDDPKLNNIQQLSYYFFSIGTGSIGISNYEPISEEKRNVLKRFRNVFELAYRRYIDVALAEAQAREARVELALERVRARTMAMQKSDELGETAFLLFQQFKELGESPDQATIGIINEAEQVIEYWVTMYGNQMDKVFRFSLDEPNVTRKIYEAWTQNEKSLVIDLAGKDLHDFAVYRASMGGAAFNPEEKRRIINVAFFSKGLINVQSTHERSSGNLHLLERFAKVFDQTYTRFLDLQKAEDQAREAQIQLALERVRARTMAMQKSDEMAETAALLFEQFIALGEIPERMAIEIVNEAEHVFEIWATEHGGRQFNSLIKTSLDEPYVMQKMYRAWKEGNKSITIDLQGNELEEYFQYLKKMKLPVDRKIFGKRRVQNVATFSRGILTIITPEPRPRKTIDILERFAAVFDGTYTRFLDLQKAEAQARESQIQLAMERVRARTMAMHHSNELAETALLLFQQLQQLGLSFARTGFYIWQNGVDFVEGWTSNGALDEILPPLLLPFKEDEGHRCIYEARLKGEHTYEQVLGGEELKQHYHWLMSQPSAPKTLNKLNGSKYVLLETQYKYAAIFKQGYLLLIAETPEPGASGLLQRFAKVFEQTYTRFLDLQKAEAQAREAIIEAALERVRSKTMAMHNSQDVGDTVSTMLDELVKLGVKTNRCGILIYSDTMTAEVWTAKSIPEGKATLTMGQLDLAVHPLLSGLYQAWKNKEPLFTYTMVGEDLIAYYRAINEAKYYPTNFELNTLPSKEFHSDFYFAEGSIFAFTAEPIPAAATIIFKRFAGVFGQTYRRYLDLQKSEANAIEAIRRSSLDRVRAETASMRTTDDLERITPLIWNELTILGVPFIRCGVFIMDQQLEQIHTFLSTPNGQAIAAFHLPYNTAQTTFQNLVEYWQKKQIYREHWDEEAFINWTRNLVKSGAISPTEKYVTGDHPTNLDLHFLPFLQGMLYVGNDTPLNEDDLHLVQNLADAFSTAYARYEDFNKLESAKTQIEKTLVDLKQAQAQLVQSEKMASLGELTAGIAHEIQNPLNFVNNFSEINEELLAEMKDELVKGNIDDALAIASDAIGNQQKILLHGKRADAIVKGMLQHSRSSSGVKEPTDINALADEYLRLAYHGLRAKDKSFNATLKTDFDESIGKINIIPQDIGRVILNLITNAFYAVQSPEQTQKQPDYNPTVSVSTKNMGIHVEIRVKDNGPGIPQNILDKIFQPFFTTKPTGQGTGLGLSMSYDIVKAHGGELKVETKENEGTEFCISIPTNEFQ